MLAAGLSRAEPGGSGLHVSGFRRGWLRAVLQGLGACVGGYSWAWRTEEAWGGWSGE